MSYRGEISCGVKVCPIASAGKWSPNVCSVACKYYQWDGVTEPLSRMFTTEEIEAGIADGTIEIHSPEPETTRKMRTLKRRRRGK